MQPKTRITIVVESVGVEYPQDPEFQSLAKALVEIDPDIEVQMPKPEPIDTSLRKLTWGELIKIFIDVINSPEGKAAETATTTLLSKKILEVTVKWAQDRFKRLNHKRPKFIWVYSPDRKLEEYVKVSGPDEKPEDQKPELVRLAKIREEVEQRRQNKITRTLRKIFKRR